MPTDLAVIETHPVQYRAPVYRMVQAAFGLRVTAIYGSDFSVAGYRDPEFGAEFAWDVDLLSGYAAIFLSEVRNGGARTLEEVSARGLKFVLKSVNPRAVLIVGYSPAFHRQAFWTAWRAGHPILFRGEATDHSQKRGIFKRWVRDGFLRWYYGCCSAILYIGQRAFAHYRRLGVPEEKLFFSPYCVDIQPFRVDEGARSELRLACRAELGFTDTQMVILFSGKLIPKKAPELLVQAVKRLPAEIREKAAVLFLGDGELRRPLEKLCLEPPTINARFVGFQNQRTLSRYYHAADLVVLPSRWGETWGLAVNEALHHGVPCVVSDAVGCAPDLIESGVTGEVFVAESMESLTGALVRALTLIRRLEVRQRCRARVAQYTVEKAAEGIVKAYMSVVRGSEGSLQ